MNKDTDTVLINNDNKQIDKWQRDNNRQKSIDLRLSNIDEDIDTWSDGNNEKTNANVWPRYSIENKSTDQWISDEKENNRADLQLSDGNKLTDLGIGYGSQNENKHALLARNETRNMDPTDLWVRDTNTSKATDMRLGGNNELEQIDVYVRMSTVNPILPMFYDKVLVQSMKYFWPDISSMVVVLDNERQEDHKFAEAIQNVFPFPRICFMDRVDEHRRFDRMQRDMLYPELCTSKKYVAYVDTDTMFVTRVIPEMLFDNGKPVIIGIYGKIAINPWNKAAKSTANIFKTKEVMKCMSTFPVIFHVEHMIKLRKYLEQLHNMSFDKILNVKKDHFFAQFNLMCQYIWMFHRDEYKFHFHQEMVGNLPREGRENQTFYDKMITQELTEPIPRPCVHYKYHRLHGQWTQEATYRKVLKSGICFMGGFEFCPGMCTQFNKTSLRKELFVFDFTDWTWDSRCLEAQRRYYKDTTKYSTSAYSEVIKKACVEVDDLEWNLKSINRHMH